MIDWKIICLEIKGEYGILLLLWRVDFVIFYFYFEDICKCIYKLNIL